MAAGAPAEEASAVIQAQDGRASDQAGYSRRMWMAWGEHWSRAGSTCQWIGCGGKGEDRLPVHEELSSRSGRHDTGSQL